MMSNNPNSQRLGDLFSDDMGSERLLALLRDPLVQDIRCNRFDRIFYTDATGTKKVDQVFPGPAQYEAFINRLMLLTDVGYQSLNDAVSSIIEGSFRPDRTDVKGSVFIATSEVTRGEPAVVIRKQPPSFVTLDKMLENGMMSVDMRIFLEMAARGRLNILVSGSSGAGKTTMARALGKFISPTERVVTCEEIDELHLDEELPNVVSLTSYRELDEQGRVIRAEALEDLVKHALRMRADRIWVGEVRGKEAYSIVKACLSGHDGSVTTIHANDAQQAIRQLVSYVMESHLTEDVAREQVASAFNIAIQIEQGRLGRRIITEIVELEHVREGDEQRRNELWRFDFDTDSFIRVGSPSPRLRHTLARHNVNFNELPTALYH
jgi:pilus assembly protein CpaF